MSRQFSKGVAFAFVFIAVIAIIVGLGAGKMVVGVVEASAENRFFYSIADTIRALESVANKGDAPREVIVSVPRGKLLLIYDCETIQGEVAVWEGIFKDDEEKEAFLSSVGGMRKLCEESGRGSKGVLVARSWRESSGVWRFKKESFRFAGEVHLMDKKVTAGLLLGQGEYKVIVMPYGDGEVLLTYVQ